MIEAPKTTAESALASLILAQIESSDLEFMAAAKADGVTPAGIRRIAEELRKVVRCQPK